ncbi:MAG: proteasome subunit alpha [Candidatus Methanosuratincola petrocarbonis]
MLPGGSEGAYMMYTPDGRLVQVEYAAEAAKYGSPVVAVRGKGFAVMVARTKEPDPLLDPMEKIHMVDENIGIAGAGFTGDIQLLVDQARVEAQRHRLVFEDPIDVKTLVNQLGQFMYQFTRYGNVRPLGASLIVIGSDRVGTHIFQLDTRGLLLSGKALAIGKNSEAAISLLRGEYRPEISMKDAIGLAVKALSSAEDGESPVEVGIAKNMSFRKMCLKEALDSKE